MRPLTLTFQAFGPYAGKEHIDFKDLTDKGLLLICGDTGSGKTMILDAMTLALYGKSSGGLRNELTSLRCNRCRPDDDTFIEFVFEAGGNVYKFERRLEKKRVNLSESQHIYVMDAEGEFKPIKEKLNKSEMPAIAQKLIGLDYDQFTQVIILPQGKFEQFLESNSGQKGEILTEIFGAQRWENAAKNYHDSVKAECDELYALKERINNVLSGENCDNLEELREKITETEKNLAALENTFKEEDYVTRRDRLLSKRETAGKLGELKKALKERQKDADAAAESVIACTAALEKAETRLREHKEKEAEKETWNKEKSALEAKRELYASADRIREDFDRADQACQKAGKHAAAAERALEKAQKSEAEAFTVYQSADKEHREVLDAFARGAAGRLAADLEEGEKCPVCGSTHHPDPAQAGDDTVSSAQVDEKFKAVGEKHEEWETARAKTQSSREAAAKAAEEKSEQEKVKAAAEKALLDSRAGMVDGIDTLQALENRVARLIEDIAAYDRKQTELADAAGKNRIHLAEAKTAREKAAAEAEKAAEELETVRKNLIIVGEEEPDTAIIDSELKKIDSAMATFQRQQGSMSAQIERLTAMYGELTDEWKAFSDQISDAENALAFAKQLRGDAGIGLKRYVLGILFDQVVYAANEMLSKVHGGRYSLVRTEDSMTGSRKKGLDLAVMDSFSDTDRLRSAGSLSGGEKFLVSLALSIGMSTIARTDGINIDAMFIDEGFGSLDEHSIGDALEVLESIRGGADSFVGIISHVQILRDSIPSKLIVHKSRRTSTIEYTMG